jgi:hypothetical protein
VEIFAFENCQAAALKPISVSLAIAPVIDNANGVEQFDK